MISRRRGSDSCQAEIKESVAGAVPGEPLGSSFRRKKRLWSRRVTWLWLWPGATWSMLDHRDLLMATHGGVQHATTAKPP